MLDSASQTTFISEKLLSKIKSKVVHKNFNATVIGFNGVKEYKTRTVEFEIGLGSRSANLKTAVVPELGMQISGNRLSKIKNAFNCRKTPLAEKHINDCQPVEILLGADYAHLLPVQSCRFGSVEKPSRAYYCAAGAMLVDNSVHLA